MKCSELTRGKDVVFKRYSNIYKRKIAEMGTVIDVVPERKKVCIVWLEGYKSRTDFIPYEDMLAVGDENGEQMSFDNISGKAIALIPE